MLLYEVPDYNQKDVEKMHMAYKIMLIMTRYEPSSLYQNKGKAIRNTIESLYMQDPTPLGPPLMY